VTAWWRLLRSQGFALWLVLSALLVTEHLTMGISAPPWWVPLIGVLAIAFAVATRRSRPLLALAIALGMTMAVTLRTLASDGTFPVSCVVVLSVISWLAGRRTDSARGFVVLIVVANVVMIPLGLPLRGERPISAAVFSWLFTVLWSLIFVVLPWLLGRYRRQQALLAWAGWERAERMEHEQQMVVEQARLRERARIAQDMHDSLGHELSLIALRAGGLEMANDIDERYRTAAGELRASAAAATTRLGEIIGILREEGQTQAPLQPPGETIAELVERATESGLDVRLVTEGSSDVLPQVVKQAANRVVQEALTNASKHAPGAPVTVRVRHNADQTLVTVTNTAAVRGVPALPSGGRGLPGLEERARILGGTLHAVPRDDGGFEVVARLPHADAGVAPVADEESESAAALALARTRARRGLVTAVVAPAALALGLGALILGYYLVIGYTSVLEPARYAQLRVGQQRAEVASVLPPLQMLDDPSDADKPRPPGSTCEFYRPDDPFSATFTYRLCFVDGRLAAKDVVRTGTPPVEQADPGR
jgi:signal transduction histidine kinase